jgi:hypothetical protein
VPSLRHDVAASPMSRRRRRCLKLLALSCFPVPPPPLLLLLQQWNGRARPCVIELPSVRSRHREKPKEERMRSDCFAVSFSRDRGEARKKRKKNLVIDLSENEKKT